MSNDPKDPNAFDNMTLPEDDHQGWDGEDHDQNIPELDDDDLAQHQDVQPPAKRSLNLKKIGLLVGAVVISGAGITYGPELYSTYFGDSAPAHPTVSPHRIKPVTRQMAQNAPAPVAQNPAQDQQPTSLPLALPEAPKPAAPAARAPAQEAPAPGNAVGLALPDGSKVSTAPAPDASPLTLPAQGQTQAAIAQMQPSPAAQPVAPPAAPAHTDTADSGSLTNVLNALHDNGKVVSDSVDRASAQISQHIDTKSDEVMARLTQMQNSITALTSKTEELSKGIETVETHGLQKPIQTAGDSKKPSTQHVTKPRKVHHYRITSSPAAIAEPVNANLSGYHLRGFAKNMVLIQGPSGLMSVPIGSPAMLNGKPVPAIGTVQGLIRDGDKYVAKTTTGSIVQE
mgnify:CR=1 FL=1